MENARVGRMINMERGKFRNQSTGPSLNHSLRVIRHLEAARGFHPERNMTSKPTSGADSEYDLYDPNPMDRWAPNLRKQVEAQRGKTKGKQYVKDPETGELVDPETGQPVGNVNPQDPERQEQPADDNPEDPQADVTGAQQAGEDPNAAQDLDPNAGVQQGQDDQEQEGPPEKPELPGDQRKDPKWKGHKAAKLPQSDDDASARVVKRYDIDKDPLGKKKLSSSSYDARRNMRTPQSHSKTGKHGPIQKYWG